MLTIPVITIKSRDINRYKRVASTVLMQTGLAFTMYNNRNTPNCRWHFSPEKVKMGLHPRLDLNWLCLLLIFVCLITNLAGAASFKHSYAVVVGIEFYSTPQWKRLPY